MDRKFACYCGLCCENCALKVKVFPAAKTLRSEMEKAGFDAVMHSVPGGNEFWSFLKEIAEHWTCTTCKEDSGNPGCKVRKCAREKDVEMCAFCGDYPCELTEEFNERSPGLKADNTLLRDKGWDAWEKLQDKRKADGFTYTDDNRA